MKKLPRFIALGVLIGLATALSAQAADGARGPRGRGPGGPGRGPGQHIVRLLDSDMNREISATELANAPANIRALDLNADGTVTVDELRPPRPADAPTPPADRPASPADADHPRPLNPVMLALDANADGDLSTTEIANAIASLNALDLNKDGKLTADEFMPLPPEDAPVGRGGHRHAPPSAG
jgi:hypothetical protein